MNTGRGSARAGSLAIVILMVIGAPIAAAADPISGASAPPPTPIPLDEIGEPITDTESSPESSFGPNAPPPPPSLFAIQIFNETFPSTTVNTSNWQTWTGAVNTICTPAVSNSMEVDGTVESFESVAMDLSVAQSANISMLVKRQCETNPPDTSDELFVEYWNGATWACVREFEPGTTATLPCVAGQQTSPGLLTWMAWTFPIPAPGLISGARIRFRASISLATEDYGVDDIRITYEPKGFATTIASVPAGLQVIVNGTPQATPYNFVCAPGGQRVLNITTPQALAGTQYSFASWSDAGPQNRTITCTAPATYTANFNAIAHSQTVDTIPAGRDFRINASSYSTPQIWWCPIGTDYTVDVPSPQGSASTRYLFSSWSDAGAKQHLVVCSAPRTVTARFNTEHNISMVTSPAALQLSVNGSSSTAPFAFWCLAGTPRSVSAPSPQGVGDTRQVFMGWSDGGAQTHSVTCNTPRTLQANFTTGYRTTLAATDPGLTLQVNAVGNPSPYDYWCPGGSTPTINAPSPQIVNLTRYVFTSWSDAGAQSHSVTCSAPATYTANYDREFRLFVGSSPGGLQVKVDGVNYTAPYTAYCPEGNSHTINVASPQGVGNTRFVFSNWSDSGAQSHLVTCSAPVTVTANFRTEHNITIATSPTGLEVVIGGIPRTAPYSFWCDGSTSVVVNATSPQGAGRTRYAFSSWSDAGAQQHSLACGAPRIVTANFLVAHEISIETNTPGLNVSVNGTQYAAPHIVWCFANTTQTIFAPSPQGTGDVRPVFVNWSDGGTQSHVITCDVPKNITATYTTGFRTTLASSPSGLSLQVNGNPQNAPFDYWCANQTSITVNAPSPQGTGQTRSTFQSWSDAGAQSHSVSCTAPVTLTATYVTEHETTITTNPVGLQILLGGTPHTAPHVFWCVQGPSRNVNAPSPQDLGSTRYVFGSWSDSGAQNHSITCPAPATLAATFATSAYSVRVDTAPTGLQVHVDGSPQTAPYQFWCGAGSTHSVSAPSPQGTGTTQNVYTAWSDGGTQTHNVTCSSALNATATFATAFRTTVDSSPAGLQVEVDGAVQTAPFAFWCQSGTSRKINAPSPQTTGGSRMVWKSWSDSGGQSHLVNCAAPDTFTATFAQEHQVTLASDPPGLRLEVNGQGVSLPYSLWCSPSGGTTVNAPSPQGSGGTQNTFTSWSDAGAQSHTLACTAPGTLTAKFATQYRITVATSPAGLKVEAAGTPGTAPADFWCDAGGSGTVNAPSPQENGPTRYVFASWSDGGGQSHAVKCDSPTTVTATFLVEHRTTIATDPPGMAVEVAGQSQAAPYEFWCAQGTSVTLGAPAEQDSGGKTYVFDAWSDGRDRVRTISCGSPATYTAKYKLKPAAIPPPPEDTILGMPSWLAGTLFIVVAVVLGIIGAIFGQRRRKTVEGPEIPTRYAPSPPPGHHSPPAPAYVPVRPGAPPPPPSMRGTPIPDPVQEEAQEEAQEVPSDGVIGPDQPPSDQGWQGWPPEK